MSDMLLRELSNADIDWMVTTGTRQQLTNEAVLIRPEQSLEAMYLLLEGTLAVKLPSQADKPTNEENTVATMSRGELLGESWLFNTRPVVQVVAAPEATVLSVSKSQLEAKLSSDVEFAAHFYRALALIMSERIRRIFEHPERVRYGAQQTVKEAVFVFSELHDSDIDWMVRRGTVEKVSAGQILLHAGRPVDALYTVVDGQFEIALSDQPCDPLSLCSQGLSEQAAKQSFKTATYISRGGLPGIIAFLDFRPLPVTIRATESARVLAIPRQQVAIKLQEDLGFASRFYRVIATQMANLLGAVTLLRGDTGAASDQEELNLDELQQVCHGGTKFDWMLKQLGVSAS
ncbi:MAG: cyclic nucleotide-binding domain-containing protein [Cyanobacteria bacterium J06628_6]